MNRLLLRIVGMCCALLVAGCDRGSTKFTNVDVTGSSYARDFALLDSSGKTRTLADFRGKVVLIFFGYTQCPDVCPTALAEMRSVLDSLGADAARVQVLFVTVDPERDTPELLANYVPAFHPSFIGLYGDPASIARTAKEFKIFYQRREGKTPTSYTVDHSAGSYVYDTNGRLRLFVRHGLGPAAILPDIKVLLTGA